MTTDQESSMQGAGWHLQQLGGDTFSNQVSLKMWLWSPDVGRGPVDFQSLQKLGDTPLSSTGHVDHQACLAIWSMQMVRSKTVWCTQLVFRCASISRLYPCEWVPSSVVVWNLGAQIISSWILVIISTCQLVNVSTCQLVIMSTCQQVNLPACQHISMSS